MVFQLSRSTWTIWKIWTKWTITISFVQYPERTSASRIPINSFLFGFLPTISCLVTRNNADYLLSNHHDSLFPLKMFVDWRLRSEGVITKSNCYGQNLPFTELSVLLKLNSLKQLHIIDAKLTFVHPDLQVVWVQAYFWLWTLAGRSGTLGVHSLILTYYDTRHEPFAEWGLLVKKGSEKHLRCTWCTLSFGLKQFRSSECRPS